MQKWNAQNEKNDKEVCGYVWNETTAEYTTKRKRTVRKRFFDLNRHGLREADIYVSRETYMPAFLRCRKNSFWSIKKKKIATHRKKRSYLRWFFRSEKIRKQMANGFPYDISWTQSLCGLSAGAFNTHWHKYSIHRLVFHALETGKGECLSAFKK